MLIFSFSLSLLLPCIYIFFFCLAFVFCCVLLCFSPFPTSFFSLLLSHLCFERQRLSSLKGSSFCNKKKWFCFCLVCHVIGALKICLDRNEWGVENEWVQTVQTDNGFLVWMCILTLCTAVNAHTKKQGKSQFCVNAQTDKRSLVRILPIQDKKGKKKKLLQHGIDPPQALSHFCHFFSL